jgi:hypothetical protein
LVARRGGGVGFLCPLDPGAMFERSGGVFGAVRWLFTAEVGARDQVIYRVIDTQGMPRVLSVNRVTE